MRPEGLPHVDTAALAEMIDPARTAILVVDVQVDFAAPDGTLGRKGVDLAPAAAAIDRMEQVIAAARGAGMAVGFIQVATREETDAGALQRLYARKGRPPAARAICREGTQGIEPYRLMPQHGDFIVRKRKFDAFHETDLLAILQLRGIGAVVMLGLTTDCCVDQSARSAFHHDFDVFVVSDACAAYSAALHLSALTAMEKNCVLLTDTDAFVRTFA